MKVDKRGNETTVATGFPSGLSKRPDVNGLADIAFLDGELYAVTAGGGCSHGSTMPNMVAKVDAKTGHWTMLANLSEAVAAHLSAVMAPDFEADGLFYSMLTVPTAEVESEGGFIIVGNLGPLSDHARLVHPHDPEARAPSVGYWGRSILGYRSR